jgi:choline dehydrogenase-like flavoprotein
VSSAPVGNTGITRFDVCIIGSGAGGGAAAYVLAKAGKKVLVLEVGPNRFDALGDASRQPISRFSPDEVKLAYRNFIYPDPVADPRTWRTTTADGDRTFVGDVNGLAKTVGGGAVHADLKMPRFMPQDFTLGTTMRNKPSGTSFVDWPVNYDMLEAFYSHAETVIGVQGTPGADPFEGYRSKPLPMPPGLPMYVAVKASQGLSSLGYHPFPYPSAINSVPYDGRPACQDCGLCSGYGCPTNAKGSPAVTTLRKALLSGNCLLLPETKAVKLVMNGAKDTVTGVEAIDPSGNRQVYTADQYILAASPIEDARLLLLSDPGGNGIGNSSDQVGRNLTFHLHNDALGIWKERLHGHRGRTVTHAFTDFRGTPNDPDHPLGGICEISGSLGPVGEAAYLRQVMDVFGFNGARFKRLMREAVIRERVIIFAMVGEDAPQPTNRVDLDPAVRDIDGIPVPRVTYKSHDWELAAREFYKPKLIAALGAAGAHFAALSPASDIPSTSHIMGTLRMGTDPRQSVCDATGRFHDVGNLYNADGALFPTSSGFNPTMTIMALAMRVAAGIAFPGTPERALS